MTLHSRTICELSQLIRHRMVSPLELVDAYLARISEWNTDLAAYIAIDWERARDYAKGLEEEVSRGHIRSPLHGIPVAVKDTISTRDMPTTGHSRALEGLMPSQDATALAQLKAAGAIVLGKLSTHECGFGQRLELPFPPAKNPWNFERSPEGSSSGSAVAIAADLAAGTLGTDTGGSIRLPAAACGVVGLKPTLGRVNRTGILPVSDTQDVCGPLARSVEDCALLFSALASNHHKLEFAAKRSREQEPAGSDKPLDGIIIGIVPSWYGAESALHPDIKDAFEKAINEMADLGAVVRGVGLPDIALFNTCGSIITHSEAFSVHHANLRNRGERYGSQTRKRLLIGAFISAEDYLRAQSLRRVLVEQMNQAFENVDAIVTPTHSHSPGPLRDQPSATVSPHYNVPYATIPFSVSGHPALSVCCGFTSDGLPIGLQVAGRHFAEEMLFHIAGAYERAAPWSQRRSPLLNTPDATVSQSAQNTFSTSDDILHR